MTQTKKISASWTLDPTANLPEFDVEQELMDVIVDELRQELDKEILGVMSVSGIFSQLQNQCKKIYHASEMFESSDLRDFTKRIIDMSWDADVYQQTNCSGYVETLTWDLDLIISRLNDQDRFTYNMLGIK